MYAIYETIIIAIDKKEFIAISVIKIYLIYTYVHVVVFGTFRLCIRNFLIQPKYPVIQVKKSKFSWKYLIIKRLFGKSNAFHHITDTFLIIHLEIWRENAVFRASPVKEIFLMLLKYSMLLFKISVPRSLIRCQILCTFCTILLRAICV